MQLSVSRWTCSDLMVKWKSVLTETVAVGHSWRSLKMSWTTCAR